MRGHNTICLSNEPLIGAACPCKAQRVIVPSVLAHRGILSGLKRTKTASASGTTYKACRLEANVLRNDYMLPMGFYVGTLSNRYLLAQDPDIVQTGQSSSFMVTITTHCQIGGLVE